MKRIVILCDGTWNFAEAEHPTNVVRVSHALAPLGADGVAQVPIYVEGVGTGRRGVTALTRGVDRLLGGAMGIGLIDNVVEAYRHLCFLYQPGDEVHVFGFSRGAFTARSLAGFIRFTGLLDRTSLARLPEAVTRYSERLVLPAGRRQRRNAEWRAIHSPWVMVDPDDADIYAEFGNDEAIPFDIAYLGVWDTVGALGVPGHFTAAPLLNRRFTFHDTDLSAMVRSARHAVSVDERRTSFRPTLWTNLDALNAGREGTPYRQAWFAGDHGSVGGGGEITALSAIALLWVLEGAAEAGLEFDEIVLRALAREADPMGPLHNADPPRGGTIAALMRRLGGPRDPVALFDHVHDAVRERWVFEAKDAGFRPYRPEPLRGLERDFAEWQDARLRPPEDGQGPRVA
ncbi:DUF2235 domain-containing protein [Jannaschia formosa]|uniref:DUF2235 domain-containing protein n=1 Tax=Jannaschia formosa TaxID=2259592 RepID=UPI000E1C3C3B|nr:DUF2235 domain-containing protein [Jannaschia formosa]TFL16786.1 DUF2235 domain-containing protein [Jannaschia formosa]